MLPRLPAESWAVIAGATTLVYVPVARWCMPTPKAKRGVSLVPLGGVLAGTLLALVRGHSLSYGLYLYSWALLGLLIMLVPVRRRTAADILEQERDPWTKVSLNPVSTGWLVVSLLACLVGVVLLSPLAR